MNIISVLSMGSGLWASWLWLKASRVKIESSPHTTASVNDNPAAHILDSQVDNIHLMCAMQNASALNKKAALWTAGSIFLNALASFGI